MILLVEILIAALVFYLAPNPRLADVVEYAILVLNDTLTNGRLGDGSTVAEMATVNE